jgi:hypothetical protein
MVVDMEKLQAGEIQRVVNALYSARAGLLSAAEALDPQTDPHQKTVQALTIVIRAIDEHTAVMHAVKSCKV